MGGPRLLRRAQRRPLGRSVRRNDSSDELEEVYRSLALQSLSGVVRQFLLCRFALAVLAKSIFLQQTVVVSPKPTIAANLKDLTECHSHTGVTRYRKTFKTIRTSEIFWPARIKAEMLV